MRLDDRGRRGAWRRRVGALVAGAAIVIGATAFGLSQASRSTSAAVPRSAREESNSAEHVDFNEPLLAGRKFSSVADAAPALPFRPHAPAALGQPVGVWLPAQARQHLLALVYQHPTYGRFMAIEVPSVGTQQDLEGLVAQCAAAACEERWSLVRLDDGSEAVLFEGSASIPYQTTGMIWSHDGLALNVLGPAATFSREAAFALANLFTRASA